jgi:2-oxoisovalerate dehydrogenase E1 component
MLFDRKDLTDQDLLNLYRQILLPRMIEEKMLVLLRQGKVSKWFSGIGQEAIAVGVTSALRKDEWIMPLHRNLGVFTTREMPLAKLMKQWQGAYDGYSKGRERSFHFGSQEHYICGMISHLGPQLSVADGVALAYSLKEEDKVSVAFTGEGGSSEGEFHEALNLAAVWNLPVIFIVENNGYALSTPVSEQFKNDSFVDKAKGYGIDAVKINGNDILAVYDTVKGVREYCITTKQPYLIECTTFRMRGHEEASGTKYVPSYLFDIWKEKDPIDNYEKYLLNAGVLTEDLKHSIRNEFKAYIDASVEEGLHSDPIVIDTKRELNDIYAPQVYDPELKIYEGTEPGREKRFIEALSEGLDQALEKHPNLIIMGQDIAEYGGAFKVTQGLVDKYGKKRIRNTPLCESAVVGAALGLSLENYKSVMEMQFADFVSVGFNQIVNNLAKIHYRWGQNADVVIRMPTGAGVGAGPFHSQSNEAWFAGVAGLKVVYPSSPAEAKGLLIAAIEDPNPVMFFEHKVLYRSITGPVPEEYYSIEIGKARVVEEGEDISIITYGTGVHWAKELAAKRKDISFHILDLRTLAPLDYEAIRNAVAATGKVLVLHEDTLTAGIGGNIAAWITENCFEMLDGPVMRCASLDTPVPFNVELEKNFLAKARLEETVDKLYNY